MTADRRADPIKEMERIKRKHFNKLPKVIKDVLLANKRMYANWWLDYYRTHKKMPLELPYSTTGDT
jgi:hypothetical protein